MEQVLCLHVLTLIFLIVDLLPCVGTGSIVRFVAKLPGDWGVTSTPPGPGGFLCTPSVCRFKW